MTGLRALAARIERWRTWWALLWSTRDPIEARRAIRAYAAKHHTLKHLKG